MFIRSTIISILIIINQLNIRINFILNKYDKKCGPNKKIIRNLSMVLRMHYSDNEERLRNVQ